MAPWYKSLLRGVWFPFYPRRLLAPLIPAGIAGSGGSNTPATLLQGDSIDRLEGGAVGIVQNEDEAASDLVVTRERVTTGYLGPNFTRSYRLDDGDLGSLAWEKRSGGDVQTAAMLGEDKLVIGGHFG